MSLLLRFSELSPPRRALVRLCQRMNFGQIQNVRVQGGNPVFDPHPFVLIDERLDVTEEPRQETTLADFVLAAELRRLMARLDEIGNGTIERIEVRAGLPRRVVFESRLSELFPLENMGSSR
jgi:hypothetical protein